jgi:hypothetical protein
VCRPFRDPEAGRRMNDAFSTLILQQETKGSARRSVTGAQARLAQCVSDRIR